MCLISLTFLQAVLLVSLSIAAAAVSGQRYNPRPAFRSAGPFIPIVSDRRTGPLNGAYDFAFETGNGIRRNERGTPSGPRGTVVSRGDWRWGKLNWISYFSAVRISYLGLTK